MTLVHASQLLVCVNEQLGNVQHLSTSFLSCCDRWETKSQFLRGRDSTTTKSRRTLPPCVSARDLISLLCVKVGSPGGTMDTPRLILPRAESFRKWSLQRSVDQLVASLITTF